MSVILYDHTYIDSKWWADNYMFCKSYRFKPISYSIEYHLDEITRLHWFDNASIVIVYHDSEFFSYRDAQVMILIIVQYH